MELDIVKKDEFDKIKKSLPPLLRDDAKIKELTKGEFKMMLLEMENPVNSQKEIAVRIKQFLDFTMDKELRDKGFLTDNTRRWVEQFSKVLDSIQKALHGDKSVNLHLHQVSHSNIAAKIRSAEKD